MVGNNLLQVLEITNFFSIRATQRIDVRIGGGAPPDPDRLAEDVRGTKVRVPRVVALFGPNGAGKSTVLKALNFVVSFARDSFQWTAGQPLPIVPFNDGEASSVPSSFAVEFGGPYEVNEQNVAISRAVYR
ncbi:MAG: AAA family ATPase, partial [Vulcanimicrobiaceae bacterium]